MKYNWQQFKSVVSSDHQSAMWLISQQEWEFTPTHLFWAKYWCHHTNVLTVTTLTRFFSLYQVHCLTVARQVTFLIESEDEVQGQFYRNISQGQHFNLMMASDKTWKDLLILKGQCTSVWYFNGNSSRSCWDVSVWSGELTDTRLLLPSSLQPLKSEDLLLFSFLYINETYFLELDCSSDKTSHWKTPPRAIEPSYFWHRVDEAQPWILKTKE